MQKIISLFQRNYDGDKLVRNEVVPGAEWVLRGEGTPTRKFDGTCCLVRDGKLYKRYEVAKGKKPPPNFEAASEIDPITGKQQGWLPVSDGPEDKYHREAWNLFCCIQATGDPEEDNGTYELLGPKIQGNPEGKDKHKLEPHGCQSLDCPRDFDGIKAFLAAHDIEGVVWHHPDGRMVKIKGKDFGINRSLIKPR